MRNPWIYGIGCLGGSPFHGRLGEEEGKGEDDADQWARGVSERNGGVGLPEREEETRCWASALAGLGARAVSWARRGEGFGPRGRWPLGPKRRGERNSGLRPEPREEGFVFIILFSFLLFQNQFQDKLKNHFQNHFKNHFELILSFSKTTQHNK